MLPCIKTASTWCIAGGLVVAFLLPQSVSDPSDSFGKWGLSQQTVAGVAFLDGFPEEPTIGRPTRLIISSIKVDAAFEYVGLSAEGEMDVPKDPARAGWFGLGPQPGEAGNAIIAGHYGWKEDEPAVFDRLHAVEKGDEVQVVGEDGTILTFVVRTIRMYRKEDDASSVFSSTDGKPHLVLVTCEGKWDKTEKTYASRLVVFADLK